MLLKETSVAEWQALLNEAQAKSLINLAEEIESYLVFLLMRFTSKPEIAESVLGLEFLEHCQKYNAYNQQDMRDLGDKCLLFSGLFPGRAEKKQVPLSYFINIGQSAYFTLSEQENNQIGKLYLELSIAFPSMTDVLHASRNTAQSNIVDLFDAYELALSNHNPEAQNKLLEAIASKTPLISSNLINNPKLKN